MATPLAGCSATMSPTFAARVLCALVDKPMEQNVHSLRDLSCVWASSQFARVLGCACVVPFDSCERASEFRQESYCRS